MIGKTSLKFSCRGICMQYKVNNKYTDPENGFCSCSGIFIRWEGIFCPCCNAKLRRSPRNAENRRVNYKRKNNIVYQ